MSHQKYWATEDKVTLLGYLNDRVEGYYNFIQQTLLPIWRKSFQTYNAATFTNGSLQSAGDNNEFLKLTPNHYRNLIDHAVVIAINSRPAWQPRAINGDTTSLKQCILAAGLLDYYMREKRLERQLRQAVIYASLYAEGFVTVDWNATTGDVYGTDPETGLQARQGDVEYAVYGPMDVIRDPNLQSAESSQWFIIREYRSKWDLIAKYGEPEDAEGGRPVTDALLSASEPRDPRTTLWASSAGQITDNDQVETFKFYHNRTDAVPDGRFTLFTRSIVLSDGPLPARKLNVYRIAPGELDTTPFGYTSNYDLLQLQALVNMLYSTVATNQAAFGVQNVLVPNGAGISVEQVTGGMNLIGYNPQTGKPEALNLCATPAEIFNFINKNEATMETLSGVNSTARGDPQSSLKSGAALALVQSMAVQFQMGLQNGYVQLLEDVGSATIDMLRTYATVPRIAMIAGKSKMGMMKEFSSEDLSSVNRVQVDVGNPLSKTTAGKIELATMLVQNKLINTPQELLTVIETGTLDPLTDGPVNELMAIKAENESLADGKQVPVLITDNHAMHISEHKSVLSDPIVRQDASIVEVATSHLMEHIRMLKDPAYKELLELTGQAPLAPQGPQAGVPGAPPGMNVPGANTVGAENMPNLPNAPKNALTGEPAPMPPGAAVQ